jgi:peroxiredoxin
MPAAVLVAERLVGMNIPSLTLDGSGELALDLSQYSRGFPLIVYVYVGSGWSPEDGDDTPLRDAQQHRAFRDHRVDLEARGYRAIGISSQNVKAQSRATLEHRLSHQLLSDPALQLAERLQLPTFADQGNLWYRRLTLVVRDGRIVKVFFPVTCAARSAAQVIAWMTLQGIS